MSAAQKRLAEVLGALALLAGVAWLAWPAPARQWLPFQAPEVVEIQFTGERGVAADVCSAEGRIAARKPVALVFRWLDGPVSLEVRDPLGSVALLLGPQDGSGARLAIDDDGALLQVDAAGQPPQRLASTRPTRVQLAYADGAYRALLDGVPAGAPVAGAAPDGPASLRLAADASVRSIEVATDAGETRRVEADPPPPGLQRTAWALVVALLGLACLRGWVRLLARGSAPRSPGRLACAAGLLAALVLVLGVGWTLHAANAERLGVAPEPCATEPFTLAQARVVRPGAPLTLGARRDGDFTLTASVVLAPDSAVDLLLRAGLPRVDRQLLVTLSSDPALPSGLARNLGDALSVTEAPAALARLPSGRPLALEVRCRDERCEVTLDGALLGRVSDLDLRTGRTALHALSGQAEVSALVLQPTGQPQALTGILRAWVFGSAALIAVALLFLVLRSGRGLGALLWVWPLTALVLPLQLEALAVPTVLLAALLLLFTPRRGRRILALAAGAVVIGLSWWALSERAPVLTPATLNRMQPADIAGPPLPERYLWARHPLCRRFNGYLKTQTFRDEVVGGEREPDSVRVITVGSSSTFGYGVSAREAWSKLLELQLPAPRPGARVQVVNAGVPGGTAERLRSFVEGVLLELQPDAIVINLSFNDHILGGLCDERAHFAAMTGEGIGPLDQALARWQADRARSGWSRYVQQRQAGEPVDPDDVQRYSTEPARRFEASLRDMLAACAARGVAVLLVAEPSRDGAGNALIAPFHEALEALGREFGVPVVAPQAALDAAGGALFLDMVHPTPAGHRIIARAVGAELARLLAAPR